MQHFHLGVRDNIYLRQIHFKQRLVLLHVRLRQQLYNQYISQVHQRAQQKAESTGLLNPALHAACIFALQFSRKYSSTAALFIRCPNRIASMTAETGAFPNAEYKLRVVERTSSRGHPSSISLKCSITYDGHSWTSYFFPLQSPITLDTALDHAELRVELRKALTSSDQMLD